MNTTRENIQRLAKHICSKDDYEKALLGLSIIAEMCAKSSIDVNGTFAKPLYAQSKKG